MHASPHPTVNRECTTDLTAPAASRAAPLCSRSSLGAPGSVFIGGLLFPLMMSPGRLTPSFPMKASLWEELSPRQSTFWQRTGAASHLLCGSTYVQTAITGPSFAFALVKASLCEHGHWPKPRLLSLLIVLASPHKPDGSVSTWDP